MDEVVVVIVVALVVVVVVVAAAAVEEVIEVVESCAQIPSQTVVMDLSLDTPSLTGSPVLEASGTRHRHGKGQSQAQLIVSRHDNGENKEVNAQSSSSPTMPIGESKKSVMNSNNNKLNKIFENNNSLKNCQNGWLKSPSPNYSYGIDATCLEIIEDVDGQCTKTQPLSSTASPPRSSMTSPKSKRHRKSLESALGQDCKKIRKTSSTTASSTNEIGLPTSEQVLVEEEEAYLAHGSEGEDDKNMGTGEKFQRFSASVTSCISPSSHKREGIPEQQRVKREHFNRGQDEFFVKNGNETKDSSKLQADSRPSAIVKVKIEPPSSLLGFHSNTTIDSERSSPMPGPDSSITEGRDDSLVSPPFCSLSRETTKAISSFSPGSSPRPNRSPSPDGQARQSQADHQRQLQHLQQHYNPLNSYSYPQHFLGQVYPSHKMLPHQFIHNHQQLHSQLTQQANHQHQDILTRRTTSTSSSSPSSSSLPPSPDFPHPHQQHHSGLQLPPLVSPMRPQQLSPKACNFSIAAILGGSCSRKSSSSSSSSPVITTNYPLNCGNSHNNRDIDSGRICPTEKKSSSHAEARSPRRSITHSSEMASAESRPTSPTPPLTPTTPSVASPTRDCDVDVEIDVGENDDATTTATSPQGKEKDAGYEDENSSCCKVSPPITKEGIRRREQGESTKIKCRLETKDLWDKFHELGTEMIITKTGSNICISSPDEVSTVTQHRPVGQTVQHYLGHLTMRDAAATDWLNLEMTLFLDSPVCEMLIVQSVWSKSDDGH
ncbi:T-box transcription factor TBX20 [Elysia marginata]|uniref:T-box transcription factor TBX20 n=1 Tax=Elysia marginata TaxID=1093978 RepID=A0AAV4HFM5_9GAST|nr:T-box transcription factor TBX20 [Elysia marginata]